MMPKRLIPILSEEEVSQLTEICNRAEVPYLRERASAILKLANALTAEQIAASGLLRPRARQTVAIWFHRFQSDGIKGLEIKAGRGRNPAFSPSVE
jgi:transposase